MSFGPLGGLYIRMSLIRGQLYGMLLELNSVAVTDTTIKNNLWGREGFIPTYRSQSIFEGCRGWNSRKNVELEQ